MDAVTTECRRRRFDGPTGTDDLAGLEPEGRRETSESEVSGFFDGAGFFGPGGVGARLSDSVVAAGLFVAAGFFVEVGLFVGDGRVETERVVDAERARSGM